jgi:hypothetical protein
MPPVDPTGLIAALSAIPGVGPYLIYLPILFAVCKLATVFVPPPPAGSRWIGFYNLISSIGLNRGYARNAVPAGMPVEVRAAALVSAKQATAAPELATVASEPSLKTVIHPGA